MKTFVLSLKHENNYTKEETINQHNLEQTTYQNASSKVIRTRHSTIPLSTFQEILFNFRFGDLKIEETVHSKQEDE